MDLTRLTPKQLEMLPGQIRAQALKDMGERRARSQRDARRAFQAAIFLAGVLLGMLLALGIAALLGF